MYNYLIFIHYNLFFSVPLNNKGKTIASEDTSMDTHHIQPTCVAPNAFSDDDQNHRINQNDLPAVSSFNASVASCSQGKTSKIYIN